MSRASRACRVDVERPLFARVRGVDITGEPLEIEASGLEARVLQHEIDHLDGVLMLDRAPRDQRKAALRALREGGAYSPSAEEPADEDAGARRDELRIAYLGTSDVRRRGAAPPRGLARTGPRSSSRRPTARAAGAAGWLSPPAAEAASRARAGAAADRERQPARRRRGDPGRAPGAWASSAPSASSSRTRCCPSWRC